MLILDTRVENPRVMKANIQIHVVLISGGGSLTLATMYFAKHNCTERSAPGRLTETVLRCWGLSNPGRALSVDE